MKTINSILLLSQIFLFLSCGLIGSSRNDHELDQEKMQSNQERAVSNFVVETFEDYGLYQNYTFTNSKKQLSLHHKQLHSLYEIKYQMNKDGIMMGDSLRKLNKRIDTLKNFIDNQKLSTLYKLEHSFGFKKDSTIKLIRGDFFLTKNNKVDSTQINFVHNIPANKEKAYNHFVFRKAYKYHPSFELSSEEFDFYNNFHEELWNRRSLGSAKEGEFLDHTLEIIDLSIKMKQFDIKEVTKLMINRYLEDKSIYRSISNEKFSDVFLIKIDKKVTTRRNFYERTVKFSYILNGKKIDEELLFQFNEFFEIIN